MGYGLWTGESLKSSNLCLRRGDHIKIMLRIYIKVCTCEESFELYASVFPIVYAIETHKKIVPASKRNGMMER